MQKKDIAITVQNFVQFYSLKTGIDELIKKNYSVDIYIPFISVESGVGKMFDETFNKLKLLNYSIKRKTDLNVHYKILLEPYPMDIYLKFNFDYRIKYKYAPISAKPNLTLNPENNIYYDCILCSGEYEANYLRVYSDTKIIGNLKQFDYAKQTKTNSKKTLLYLPTYGDYCSIDDAINSLSLLKEKYYIITKLHHGTSYLTDENYRIQEINDLSDETYDHTKLLPELLQKADVVLSDNSGSIFESICAEVPVAVFSVNPNKNKIGNFNTTQYELIRDGIIPYSNNPSKIENILESATSKEIILKQLEIKNKLINTLINPCNEFVSIIENYLTDNIDFKYKNMHDVLKNNYIEKINLIDNLSQTNSSLEASNMKLQNSNKFLENLNNSLKLEILDLKENINSLNKTLTYYENGKLYKLSRKIYNTYHMVCRKKGK